MINSKKQKSFFHKRSFFLFHYFCFRCLYSMPKIGILSSKSTKCSQWTFTRKRTCWLIFANDLLNAKCKLNGVRRPWRLLDVSCTFNLRPVYREGKLHFLQHKPGKLTCGWVFLISNRTVVLLHFYFVLIKMFVEKIFY